MFKNIKDMNRLLKQNKDRYKCLYMNMVLLHYVFLYMAAIHNKYKVVVHSHMAKTSNVNLIYLMLHYLNRIYVSAKSARLFACSTAAGEWLFGEKAMARGKVTIIYNAISVENYLFNPQIRQKIRKQLNIENRFVIGNVGRLVNQKNHSFLIDIFNKVHEKNHNSMLMLIGEGELENVIKQKVKTLGLTESVLFMGVQKNVEQLLQAMDVFVFPSKYEGLGIAAIEAQASGLPTVASDKVPKEAQITNLFSYCPLDGSVNEWAEKILKYSNLYNRKSSYEEIKNAGYDINFEALKMQDIFLKIK